MRPVAAIRTDPYRALQRSASVDPARRTRRDQSNWTVRMKFLGYHRHCRRFATVQILKTTQRLCFIVAPWRPVPQSWALA